MGQGKSLTDSEKDCIKALKRTGCTQTEAARQIGRSEAVVRSFVKLGDRYGIKKSPGRQPKLSKSAKRNIFKLATTKHLTPTEIKVVLDLPVSKTRIQQVLHHHPNAECTKRMIKDDDGKKSSFRTKISLIWMARTEFIITGIISEKKRR